MPLRLRSLENLIQKEEVEFLIVLPGDRDRDGLFTDITVSVLTSEGEQIDFVPTPSELRQKARLKKLHRLLVRNGILLLDQYGLIFPKTGPAAPGDPGAPGLPKAA